MLSGAPAKVTWRLRGLEVLATLFILAVYVYFAASDLLVEFGGDNAVYWLTANHYSPYGPEHPLAAEFAATSKYPPLYPIVLAVLGGGTSVFAAHLVSAALLCLGLFAARAFYLELGIPRAVALGFVVVLALVPVLRFGATELQSENFFLPLSLFAVAQMVRHESRTQASSLIPIGVLLAASVLTRTAGITLLAACAAHALSTWRPAWLVPLGIAGLAWLVNSYFQHSTNAYAAELIDSYIQNGPFDQLFAQLANLPLEWSRALGGTLQSWPPVIVLSALGVLMAVAALRRAWQRKIDGYYAVAYLGLLLLWPFPAEMQRLSSMILPVLLGQVYLLVTGCRILSVGSNSRVVAGLVALPILTLAVPDTLGFLARLQMDVPEQLQAYRRMAAWQQHEPMAAFKETALRRAFYLTMADISRLVPPDQCVYSIKPSVVSLYGRRRSALTPPEADPATFRAAALAGGCRYFLMSLLVSPSAPKIYHPLAILREELTPMSQHADPFDARKPVMAMLAAWKPRDTPP